MESLWNLFRSEFSVGQNRKYFDRKYLDNHGRVPVKNTLEMFEEGVGSLAGKCVVKTAANSAANSAVRKKYAARQLGVLPCRHSALPESAAGARPGVTRYGVCFHGRWATTVLESVYRMRPCAIRTEPWPVSPTIGDGITARLCRESSPSGIGREVLVGRYFKRTYSEQGYGQTGLGLSWTLAEQNRDRLCRVQGENVSIAPLGCDKKPRALLLPRGTFRATSKTDYIINAPGRT